jgi:prepilin-type processing-associated H-X9-DG protein
VIAIIAILAAILYPVFAQAREKARGASCLSNSRQIGLAFQMYTQDWDDYLPLTTFPMPENSWTDRVQPYIRSRHILRCPSDCSQNWEQPIGTEKDVRRSSYFLNAWMAGTNSYGRLSAVNSPASVIYMAESAENVTRDHFHPFYWGSPPELVSAFMNKLTWDAETGLTKELALRRHQGGFNVSYMDGHAKWVRWEASWWQQFPGIKQGGFDPRQ